jgi:hypothetical protein
MADLSAYIRHAEQYGGPRDLWETAATTSPRPTWPSWPRLFARSSHGGRAATVARSSRDSHFPAPRRPYSEQRSGRVWTPSNRPEMAPLTGRLSVTKLRLRATHRVRPTPTVRGSVRGAVRGCRRRSGPTPATASAEPASRPPIGCGHEHHAPRPDSRGDSPPRRSGQADPTPSLPGSGGGHRGQAAERGRRWGHDPA